MERLTTNKNVTDMSMIELAHNSCYVDDEHNARYRDYDLDINGRQLVKSLAKDICNEDLTDLSDEEFDEYMGSMLSVEIDSTIGLLALFYRNLWAMADLREKLKYYEDAEEQGWLLRLPCKAGDKVYIIVGKDISEQTIQRVTISSNEILEFCTRKRGFAISAIGKKVFLTREEAEAKLKEMEESHG